MITLIFEFIERKLFKKKELSRNEFLTQIGKDHRSKHTEPFRQIPSPQQIFDHVNSNEIPKSASEALALSRKNRVLTIDTCNPSSVCISESVRSKKKQVKSSYDYSAQHTFNTIIAASSYDF